MRKSGRWATSVVAALLLGALAGCGGDEKDEKKPGANGGPPADDAAGSIAVGADRLEYPAGSAIRGFEAVAAPPPLGNLNQVRVSAAYVVRSDRAVFVKPLTVSLAVDVAKLPADLTPDRVYAVLDRGGMTERLETPVRLDRAAGRATFELSRTYPLVSGQPSDPATGSAPASVPAGPASVAVVIDGKSLHLLSTDDEPRIYAVEAHKGDGKAHVDPLREKLANVRAKYEALGYPRVAPIRIEIADLTHGGQASGGNLIEVNHASVAANPGWTEAMLGHEYFHMIQQDYVKKSLVNPSPGDLRALTPGESRWVDEGTACAMTAEILTQAPATTFPGLLLNFGYRPLNAYDQASGELHEYQARLFFNFLREKYGALRPVIADYFSQILVRKPAAATPGTSAGSASLDDLGFEALLDLEVAAMESETAESLPLFDQVVRTHFKKPLRRLYLEFLVGLYHRKDFEPVKTAGASVFGAPGEIQVPPDKSEAVPCPLRVGDSWTEGNTSSMFGGQPLSILRTIEVVRHAIPGGATGGNLLVSATWPDSTGPNDVVVVAFPVGADGKAGKPKAGNLAKPAIVADWTTYPKALVFVVNLTTKDVQGVQVVLRAKGPSDVTLGYAPVGPSAGTGTLLVATSPALGRLDANDATNGLRFTLYRAVAASGPFQKVTSNFLDRNVAEDLVAVAPGKGARLDQDRVRLFDPHVYRDGQPRQKGPFWYQVGQTLLARDERGRTTPSGEEVLSNVLGPATATIQVLKESGETVRIEGNWCSFEVALVSAEANWTCPDAEIEAVVGSWTGRFRTGRWEGARRFGAVGRADSWPSEAKARVRVPYRPGGVRVALTANGSGLSATTTVEVPAKPDWVASEAKATAEFEKAKRDLSARYAQRLEEVRKEVAGADAAFEKRMLDERRLRAGEKTEVLFGTVFGAGRDLVTKQIEALTLENVEIPSIAWTAFERASHSGPTRDPTLEVEMYRLGAAREVAQQGVNRRRATEMLALYEQALGFTTDAYDREQLTSGAAMEREALASLAKETSPGRWRIQSLLDPAVRVGNVALVREAYAARLAVLDERRKKPEDGGASDRDLVLTLRQMAETLSVLTGDRREATAIWRLADAVELEGAEPKLRADVVAHHEQWAAAFVLAEGVPPASLAALTSAK